MASKFGLSYHQQWLQSTATTAQNDFSPHFRNILLMALLIRCPLCLTSCNICCSMPTCLSLSFHHLLWQFRHCLAYCGVFLMMSMIYLSKEFIQSSLGHFARVSPRQYTFSYYIVASLFKHLSQVL